MAGDSRRPPVLARLLLGLVLREPEAEFVLGDIEEDYRRILERDGRRKAARWYRGQALGTAWAWAWRRVGSAFRKDRHGDDGTGGRAMENLVRDIRYAVRGLLKRPGFTALVVITLALGIGANAAIFSVVNAVMLRALPYPSADRLVGLAETVRGDPTSTIPTSAPTYRDWKTGVGSLEDMALTSPFQTLILTGEGEALRLRADFVSSEYFRLLGARPRLGRTFVAEEDRSPGEHRVVVLSDGLWRRAFGGDPTVVGRSVTLGGAAYRIVGVLRPDFEDLNARSTPTDIYLPASMIGTVTGSDAYQRRTGRYFQVVARLAPGRSLEEARAELAATMAAVRERNPETLGESDALLLPLRDRLLGNLDAPLLALLVGAVFLLVVACINVASLMLVRGAGRARDIAVRLAVGASRKSLVRQLTVEALVLALMGGATGVALAYATLGSLLELSGNNLPAWVHVRMDPTVLAASLTLTALTGLVFGLAPALRSTRTDLRTELTRGDARSGGSSGGTGRGTLVVLEVATAMVLLVGSGLMIRSFRQLQGTPMGFRTEGVLSLRVTLPSLGYESPADVLAFDDRLMASLEGRAGVEFVALWGPGVPGQVGTYTTLLPEESVVASQLDATLTRLHNVTPGALEEMEIPLLRGRTFTAEDREGSQPVAVISEGLAETLFPGEDPLGRRVKNFIPPGLDPAAFPHYEVVGVVADAYHGGRLTRGAFAVDHDLYLPVAQKGLQGLASMRQVVLLLGTVGDPAALIPTARSVIRDIDPDVPIFAALPLREVVARNVVVTRFVTVLLGIFGALSLFLAALGIYGVLSRTVATRSREIGLRMALGARAGNTARLFVGRSLRLTLAGIAVGLLAALFLTRFVSSLLYGVAPDDPWTLGATAAVLITVALLAAWLPVRRALRVDPVVALSTE